MLGYIESMNGRKWPWRSITCFFLTAHMAWRHPTQWGFCPHRVFATPGPYHQIETPGTLTHRSTPLFIRHLGSNYRRLKYSCDAIFGVGELTGPPRWVFWFHIWFKLKNVEHTFWIYNWSIRNLMWIRFGQLVIYICYD